MTLIVIYACREHMLAGDWEPNTRRSWTLREIHFTKPYRKLIKIIWNNSPLNCSNLVCTRLRTTFCIQRSNLIEERLWGYYFPGNRFIIITGKSKWLDKLSRSSRSKNRCTLWWHNGCNLLTKSWKLTFTRSGGGPTCSNGLSAVSNSGFSTERQPSLLNSGICPTASTHLWQHSGATEIARLNSEKK